MKDLDTLLAQKATQALIPLLSQKILASPQYEEIKKKIVSFDQQIQTFHATLGQKRDELLGAIGELFEAHGLEAVVADIAPLLIEEAPKSPADQVATNTTFIQDKPETD